MPDLYSLYKNPMDIYVKYDPFDHGDDWRAKQVGAALHRQELPAALFSVSQTTPGTQTQHATLVVLYELVS